MMTEQKQVIPEGYKQTAVGIIPVDWAVCPLSEITTKITDGTHDTPRPVKDGVPFLTAIHVKENSIDFDGCYFLPEVIHKEIYRRCNPEYGDVLMVNIGSGTATTAVVNVNYEFSLKNVALIKPNPKLVDGFFVNYFLGFNKEKILESISTGGAQPFLSLSQISNLQISVPTKQEQTAIANALSDVDALISELEKLIAKKQAIKTATMQQLLTGKTRLPEFALREDGTPKGYKQSELGEIPEDWGCYNLEDLATIDPENLTATTAFDYEFDYISLEQIDRGILKGTSRHKFISAPSRARRVLRHKDVLISTVRPNLMSHYLVKQHVSDLICSTGFSVVRCNDSMLDYAFLYQHLFASCINKQIDMLISGSNYPSINSSNVKKFILPIGSVEEQAYIANLLCDMDSELIILTERLNKTRQIKQGMMQELLTGKTRLVKPEVRV